MEKIWGNIIKRDECEIKKMSTIKFDKHLSSVNNALYKIDPTTGSSYHHILLKRDGINKLTKYKEFILAIRIP